MARRGLLISLVVAVLGAGTGVAGAQIPQGGKVAPGQQFVGLVNGGTGVAKPVAVKVFCAGAIRPGERGHVVGDQPLEVVRPEAVANTGNTGSAGTGITAFLGVPPTAAATVSGLATFKRYNVKKMIPTSVSAPCAGNGAITFMPFPRDPPSSRAYVVKVTFVDIAE